MGKRRDEKNIRPEWLNKTKGLWGGWFMYNLHSTSDKDGTYLDMEYEAMPEVFRNVFIVIFLFVLRFSLSQLAITYFANNPILLYLLPELIAGVGMAIAISFTSKKYFKNIIWLLILSVLFVYVFYVLSFALDYVQFYVCTAFFELFTNLYAFGWNYWVVRFFASIMVIIIFKRKFDYLKEISEDIYNDFEINTYKCLNTMFLFMPIYSILSLTPNYTNNIIFILLYFFVGLVAIVYLMLRVVFGTISSERIETRYGIVAFLFAILSIYELLCLIKCV